MITSRKDLGESGFYGLDPFAGRSLIDSESQVNFVEFAVGWHFMVGLSVRREKRCDQGITPDSDVISDTSYKQTSRADRRAL